MRFTYLSLAALVAAASFLGCQPAEEAPEPEPEPAAEEAMTDEEMLVAQTEEFAAAWADGDATAIAALFVEAGNMVGSDGESFDGRDAVQEQYEELLSGMYQGTTISITQRSAKFPSPDIAIVDGTYEILGVTDADGNEVTIEGLYTNVAVKRDGEWKIHSSRPMVPVPEPGAGT